MHFCAPPPTFAALRGTPELSWRSRRRKKSVCTQKREAGGMRSGLTRSRSVCFGNPRTKERPVNRHPTWRPRSDYATSAARTGEWAKQTSGCSLHRVRSLTVRPSMLESYDTPGVSRKGLGDPIPDDFYTFFKAQFIVFLLSDAFSSANKRFANKILTFIFTRRD